ncbi:hypothetical protein FRC00_012165 [Tulasnella sp. 408]|nr:hypothetical protein FRC00_012165 [Tulasnella sp. 408]
MGNDVDATNQYLSSLSISSDHDATIGMHVLAVPDVPEPDPVPVSTPYAVDPSMAPSLLSPLHLPSEPPSPSSSASYDSSDDESGFPGFRAYDDHEPEPSHTIDVEDSSSSLAQRDEEAISSQSPYLPSSSPKLPVSLPLDSPRWTEILAIHLPWGPSTPDELVRIVEEDSRIIQYNESVERLRDYNRQAIFAGLPLAPIPNFDGLKAPPGGNDPITSVSQVAAFSPVELKAWLEHYGLPLPQDNSGQSSPRLLLADHLGLGTVLPA